MSAVDATLDPRNVILLWASPDRANDVASLHSRLFDPAWDQQAITSLLQHPAAAAFIAQVREPCAIAGFIIGQIAADEAEILSIGVAHEWQRRGIARLMIDGLARAAQRAEAKRLFLEVSADNGPALKLYTSLGFEPVGRRKNYYSRPDGEPVDAIVLALAL